jgi:hypothetical protein
MLPLGGGGLTRPFGSAATWLACCWGSLSETFSKLSDSVYWQSADGDTLFVNLFVASTATWRSGAVVAQVADFPYAAKATTTLTVAAAGSAPTFTLAIRVPFWATTGANSVTVNGAPVAGVVPGAFLRIARTWASGDVVVVQYPQALRFEQIADPRPAWQGVGSVFFGPVMLALVGTGSDMLPLNSTSEAELAAVFVRSAPPPSGDYVDLAFTATTAQCGAVSAMPLMDVEFEAYAAVLHTAPFGGEVVAFPAAAVAGAAAEDFLPAGGAGIVPEGGAGALVLRSGEPKTSATVSFFSHVVSDAAGAHALAGVTFSYSYASGFAASSGAASNFSLVALGVDPCVDGPGPVVAVLYASPPLADFPFSACDDYTPQSPGGYLAGGDDVLVVDGTLEQATANCSALPACVALTYNGPLAPAPGQVVHAYLKSAVNFVEAPGWQTWVSSRVSTDPPAAEHDAHARNQHAHVHAHAHAHAHARGGEHHGRRSRHRADAARVRATAGAPRDPASCFSPPVPVSVSGLRLDARAGLQLAFIFDNNDRNARLLLPLNVTLAWT